MDQRHIEKKILEYHEKFDGGKIPVYENVVLIGETIVSLDGDDRDCVAVVVHDGDKLEYVFHLSLQAAVKLLSGLHEILGEEDDDDDEDELN